MVHLNKNHLHKKQLNSLFETLGKALNKADSSLFLTEILGAEEKIMLAKRLTVIILLLEGKSLYTIASTTKISPATARHIKLKLEKGDYNYILSQLGKTKKNYFTILETIDNILHLGGILPHYNGLDRYHGLGSN